MRTGLTLTAAVFAVLFHHATSVFAQLETAVQGRATIDQRVKAVEKKTDYFLLRRATKTKTWNRVRISGKRAAIPEDDRSFKLDTVIGGSDPVIANAWLNITAHFNAAGPGEFFMQAGSANLAGMNGPRCSLSINFSGGSTTINKKVFCQAVVNAQNDDVFRMEIDVYTFSNADALTVNSLTLTSHLVNQVITEPPQ